MIQNYCLCCCVDTCGFAFAISRVYTEATCIYMYICSMLHVCVFVHVLYGSYEVDGCCDRCQEENNDDSSGHEAEPPVLCGEEGSM